MFPKKKVIFFIFTLIVLSLFILTSLNFNDRFENYRLCIARAAASNDLDVKIASLKESTKLLEENYGLNTTTDSPWYMDSNENIILWNQEIKILTEILQLAKESNDYNHKQQAINVSLVVLTTTDDTGEFKFSYPTEMMAYPYTGVFGFVGLYLLIAFSVIFIWVVWTVVAFAIPKFKRRS